MGHVASCNCHCVGIVVVTTLYLSLPYFTNTFLASFLDSTPQLFIALCSKIAVKEPGRYCHVKFVGCDVGLVVSKSNHT